MKTIVIAAGYATRLGELTKNFPKPLLKIGSSTILGRMLDDIDTIPEVDEHIIVTNHRFAHIFEEWAREQHYAKPITILDDQTDCNENRLGAVCDLLLAIDWLDARKESRPNQGDLEGLDLLVVAADNILEFSFHDFVNFAYGKSSLPKQGDLEGLYSCIMCHEQPSIEKLQRTGVVVLDDDNRVLEMAEKPQEPKTHWAVPPFYIYMQKDLDMIRHAVENGCGKDAPGNLAHYLCDHTTMYAWKMQPRDPQSGLSGSALRFDIGSLDTYLEAQKKYK